MGWETQTARYIRNNFFNLHFFPTYFNECFLLYIVERDGEPLSILIDLLGNDISGPIAPLVEFGVVTIKVYNAVVHFSDSDGLKYLEDNEDVVLTQWDTLAEASGWLEEYVSAGICE